MITLVHDSNVFLPYIYTTVNSYCSIKYILCKYLNTVIKVNKPLFLAACLVTGAVVCLLLRLRELTLVGAATTEPFADWKKRKEILKNVTTLCTDLVTELQ